MSARRGREGVPSLVALSLVKDAFHTKFGAFASFNSELYY